MDKESFNNLVINFAALNEAEANDLALLAHDFPYSQVIHNLAARSAQDNNLSSKESLLHISAIYSSDRTALKSMMVAPKKARIEFVKPTSEQVVVPHDEQANEDLRQQLMNDMAALKESKRLFEQIIENMEAHKATPLAEVKNEKTEIVKEKPAAKEPKGTDGLIEEIKTTKKKIKPEGAKQIEQIEIIDQFIKTQPSITRTKSSTPPPATPSNDLSEPSSQFGENIVSETLVEILLKQGKKEKAIEALKKLIWKFPQKKAYFAAQIEELRK
ncbi:MAG: hypothetical protein QM734_13090 [Cyclobacteriaceae bacterium]